MTTEQQALSVGEKYYNTFISNLPPSYRAANLVFAYYAAFPLVFSPDMLYQLWLNFQDYEENTAPKLLPSVVVSDLLQSGLCQEVAFELYELDADFANYLKNNISQLLQNYALKLLYCHRDIALFTLSYAEHYLQHPNRRNLYNMYYWKSLLEAYPERANNSIKEALNNSQTALKAEQDLLLYLADKQASPQNPSETAQEYNKLPIFAFQPAKDHVNITDEGLARQIADKLGLKEEEEKTLIHTQNYQTALQRIQEAKTKNATQLDLSILGLTEIPEEIGELENLQVLDLSENQLTRIENLDKLPDLQQLDISGNKITDLTPLLTFYKQGVKIDVTNNPITTPPMKIVELGEKAVLRWLEEYAAKDNLPLLQAKLLILGAGGVGKTSLMHKLHDPNSDLPPPKATTVGITVVTEPVVYAIDGSEYTLNIWDFGGQDIYHPVNQFFFTTNSVYILILDGRQKQTDFHYWLQVQELLAGNSPLFILQNIRNKSRSAIPMNELRAKFGNIKEYFELDLSEVTGNHRGFKAMVSELQTKLKNLPHIGELWPRKRYEIRQALLDRKNEQYISLKQYRQLCNEHGYKELEHQNDLLQQLHFLGVVLHFADEPFLQDIVITDPQWVTNAVYAILDHTEYHYAKKGHFTHSDLRQVWHQDCYEGKFAQLLALMEKFELSFPLADAPNTYITPLLLPDYKPDYAWDEANNLQLRYTYDFMPKGILARLIVRKHALIKDHLFWKRGVVLHDQDTEAQITEDYEGKNLFVRVKGSEAKGLMYEISREIDRINSTYHFSARIRATKRVPCNCSTCKNAAEPHFYDYDKLKERQKMGKKTIECENAPYEEAYLQILLEDSGVEKSPKLGANAIKIFISYAQEDHEHLQTLKAHISPQIRKGMVVWYDQEILAGADRDTKIKQHLQAADVVLLLISADFLADRKKYIWDTEMPIIMQKHEQGQLIISIVVRDCNWEVEEQLAKIQAVNGGKALNSEADKDTAFANAARQIVQAINVTEIIPIEPNLSPAQQLITQARAQNLKRLDLGNCNLTDLETQVPELFELGQLEELVLSNEWWDYSKRQWARSINQGESNRISNLPNDIKKLHRLKKLICGGTWQRKWAISDIRVLGTLHNLTVLYLDDNAIENIEFLHNLKELRILNLNGNKITDLYPLQMLKSLQILNLNGNQMGDIAPISNLVGIKELYLNQNRLRILPIDNLINLEVIHFDNNKIEDISVLGKLLKLNTISFSNNSVISIIPILPFLTKSPPLQVVCKNWQEIAIFDINVEGNPFVNPSMDIINQGSQALINYINELRILSPAQQLITQARAQNLKRLDLGNCNLTDLETQVPELFELEQLEELVLSNMWWDWNKRTWVRSGNKGTPNTLKQLPKSWQKLRNLKTLIWGGEMGEVWQISDISTIAQLPNLQSLQLRYCMVADISVLVQLQQLCYLDLSGNKISDIHPLTQLKQLTHLRLNGNKIADARALTELQQLTYAEIERNHLKSVQSLQPLLKRLNIVWQKTGKMDNIISVYDNPISSEEISFIKEGRETLLRYFNSKEYLALNEINECIQSNSDFLNLNFVHAKLTDEDLLESSPIGAAFAKCSHVKILDLRFNELTRVPKIVGFNNLIELYISNNKIQKIENMNLFPNVEILFIGKNPIAKLEGLDFLKNLKQLSIDETLIDDIKHLADCKHLKRIDINNTKVSDISPLLPLIQSGIPLISEYYESKDGICFKNIPLTTPPMEIVKQGNEAVLQYFADLEKGREANAMQKLNVFISYSHKDEAFKEALDTHLTMLKRSNKIATWNDRAILAGTEWDNEIKQELADAHLIILLVSANFLASDYIWQEELTHAMQRHEQGTARIIPIFIKACDWKGAPFGKLQSLPRDAKPVGTADNDEVWAAVATGIRAVVDYALQKGIGVAATTDKPATTHNQINTTGNDNIVIQGINNSTININTHPQNTPQPNDHNMPNNIKTTVNNFIAAGKTKAALDFLSSQYPNNDAIERLKGDFKNNETDYIINNIIDRTTYTRELARINMAIQRLTDTL